MGKINFFMGFGKKQQDKFFEKCRNQCREQSVMIGQMTTSFQECMFAIILKYLHSSVNIV